MRFKIDWASVIAGSKFTVFALFYFVFEGNFPSTSPRGAYIWRGDLTEGFLRYRFGGLIFAGAYTWRGLFSEFYGITKNEKDTMTMTMMFIISYRKPDFSAQQFFVTKCYPRKASHEDSNGGKPYPSDDH